MYSLLCGKAAATELVIKNECAAAVRKLYRPPIRPSDWPGVLFKPPVKPGMAWTGGEIDLRGAAIGAMFAGTADLDELGCTCSCADGVEFDGVAVLPLVRIFGPLLID